MCVLFLLLFYFGTITSAIAQVYPHYSSIHLTPQINDTDNNDSDWWRTASFYQIYPRSFKDSNGDGIGDLKGITEKLYYLRDIGITATWLSPIFTSPMADFGYDISNFTEIDSLFGTMADFDNLIAEARKWGIGIILDFVPNHSSDECDWFKKSAAKDPQYKDFYVWHPGKIINGTRHPPSNWLSVFRGSAWEWHAGRGEYYFHQFLKKQPDLNYRNPKVRQAMQSVLEFWLAKGVVGFRIDSVPHVFEVAPDAQGNLPDEPRNDWVKDPEDYGYLRHIYTTDQPETLKMVYEWRNVLDNYTKQHGGLQRILLAETYSPIEVVMKYYGNGTVDGAQIPFNFLLISNLNNNSNAYDYANEVNAWLGNMPVNRTANWVIGNHDKNRVGSRLGADRIDMLNMLVTTLPGCSITYQGEEIGMLDVWISWNDTVDPSACNSNPSIYESLSRDPERTPFQWNTEKNAGFSESNKTWLPLSDNYQTINVAYELTQSRSHLNIYKQLQQLRQQSVFRKGIAEIKAVGQNVFAIKRSLENDDSYFTLMNIWNEKEYVDLRKFFENVPDELEYIIVTAQSTANINDRVSVEQLYLNPKEAVVLRAYKPVAEHVKHIIYVLYILIAALILGLAGYYCCKHMYGRRSSYTTFSN